MAKRYRVSWLESYEVWCDVEAEDEYGAEELAKNRLQPDGQKFCEVLDGTTEVEELRRRYDVAADFSSVAFTVEAEDEYEAAEYVRSHAAELLSGRFRTKEDLIAYLASFVETRDPFEVV